MNDFPASNNINAKNVITYRSAKKFTPKGPTPISQIVDSGARDKEGVYVHILQLDAQINVFRNIHRFDDPMSTVVLP